MSDEKTPPAAPVLGTGESEPVPAPAPLTFRGRPPLPAARVPAVTPPGGLAPITPTMPVLERALLPVMPSPDLAPSGSPSRASSRPPPLPDAAFAPPPPPGLPAPPPSFEELERIDDDGTPVPITLPSASLDGAAQSAAGVGAAVVTPAPIDIAAPPPAHLAPDALGLPEAPGLLDASALPAPPPAHLAPDALGLPRLFDSSELPAPELPVSAPPGAPGLLDAEPASKPPSSSSRRQIPIAPNLPQIPKPVSSRPIQHAPGIVSTQAIPLTVPARRGRSPLFVALLFALVGSAAALGVFLVLRPGTSAEASGSGDPAPVATEAPATAAPAASSAPAPATAHSASMEPPAAPGPGAPEPPAASPAPTSAPATSTAPAARPPAPPKPTAAPAATVPRKQKSDRIED